MELLLLIGGGKYSVAYTSSMGNKSTWTLSVVNLSIIEAKYSICGFRVLKVSQIVSNRLKRGVHKCHLSCRFFPHLKPTKSRIDIKESTVLRTVNALTVTQAHLIG
jgi:hypothetical protein